MNVQPLKLLVSNVRPIKGNLTELKALSTEFSFLCLTKTHLDDSISDGELFDVRNRAVHRNDRN